MLKKNAAGNSYKPVSVFPSKLTGMMIIYLSDQPETVRARGALDGPSRYSFLFDLAPDGVCLAIRRFRPTRWSLTPPFHPYRLLCRERRYISVALSVSSV